LRTVKERGFNPIAYRLLLLGARYGSKVNFTWEALEANQNALTRLHNIIESLPAATTANESYVAKAKAAMADNLDTPTAVAILWEVTKDETLDAGEKHATLLAIDALLGLGLNAISVHVIPDAVQTLADQRSEARRNKDWKKSDELRAQIAELGFEVLDTADGQKIKKL